MKQLIILTATCVAVMVLFLAFPKTPSVKAAGIQNAAGMEYCVTISGDNNNGTVFTNNCNQDVNLTVAGQKGTWAPGLLHPGGTMAHDDSNGPFRWFACNVPYIAYDGANQSQWPKYNTNQYICK